MIINLIYQYNTDHLESLLLACRYELFLYQIKNASSIGGRRRKHGATRSKVLAHVLELGKWKCFPDINQGVGKRGLGGAMGLVVEEKFILFNRFLC